MLNPFSGLMIAASGVALLPVLWTLRSNLRKRGEYNEASWIGGSLYGIAQMAIGAGITLIIVSILEVL